jgi:hypothetical protein
LSAGPASVRLTMLQIVSLPNGTMIHADNRFFAIRKNCAHEWAFAGYGAPVPLDQLTDAVVKLVTPPAIVNSLKCGYQPIWHDSANA